MNNESTLTSDKSRNKNILETVKCVALSVFCTMCLLFVSANTFAQQPIPSFELKDVTLLQVFDKLSKESKYAFIYSDELLADLNQKVSVNSKGKNLNEILDHVFKNTNLTYKTSERQITIYKKNKVEPSNQAKSSKKRTITGVVVDAKTKEPIIGATIWVKESSVGAITDTNGKYSINVLGNTGLISFSYVGYETQDVPVGDKTNLNIELEEQAKGLSEVVVVAYGTQKKESVIGAISSVSTDKLKLPTSKISNMLAGQLAGIVSINSSGEPGSGSNFYIRGLCTFNSSSQTPLVLVDGVERSLDLVDSEDIESFSILKDATATAVYGVRGANGVILISTKKGLEGKPKIAIRAESGLVGPTTMPKMVNSAQWAELYNEGYGYTHGGSKFYSDDIIQKYASGVDNDLYPNTNWMKSLYNDWAKNYKINVNVSGGGAMVKYYVAGSYYNEGSIFKEDNEKVYDYNSSIKYSKVNFRANLDINVTPTTTLTVNLGNVYEKKNQPGGMSTLWYYAFGTSPNAFPAKYSDGTLPGPQSGTGSNPYQLLAYSGYQQTFWNNAQSTISLLQDLSKLVEGLKANVKFSYDALTTNTISRSFTPATYLATGRDESGALIYKQTYIGQSALGFATGNSGNRVTYLEASLNYNRVFDEKHRIGALLLYNQREENDIVPSTSLTSLPYRNQGLAGRITYAFNDCYFAEFNLGYNGSENFSPGKRFGFFPATAVGWLVSNEKFWESFSEVCDVLKLKASYGIVGNDQIGGNRRFIYEATINTTSAGSYQFNSNQSYGGLAIGDPANPGVSWEKAKKTNAGIEANFLKGSIRLQADYFSEKRSGIFLQRKSIPDYAGLTNIPYVNVGKMNNQGIDASLEMDKKIGKLELTGRANFTYAHNTIVDNDDPSYVYAYRNRIGQTYGQIFGYQAIGFFKDDEDISNSPTQFGGTLMPGDIKYKDINGDGTVDENDESPIGYSTIPEIVYGFGMTAQWKGFDLNAFFQGT
ncbi:MAG: susC9, partial [Bacteroidetes bacterium]|nr:susC9 [Bacteroidota bacterium]